VAAAALVALTLVGGIVATTWQARRARIQESLAKAEQARAERRFDDVRKLARSVLFDYHDAIKDLPGATPVRERLVRDAREYLDSLSKEANDPSLQSELASAYERVADVQGGTMFANLGDTAGAIESYRRALALRHAIVDHAPDRAARKALAGTERKLGMLLWETGDTTSALETVRGALLRFTMVVGDDPSDGDTRFELAVSYDYLAMILQERGDPGGALEYLRSARETYAALPAAMQAEGRVRRAMSVVFEHEGNTYLSMGALAKALDATNRAIELRVALSTENPLNSDYRRALAVSYYNQGEILAKLGRTQEATASYQRDLAIVEALSAADPRNEQYRGDVAYGLIRIGDMLMLSHDAAGALRQYRRSLTMRDADVRADPANLWKRASLIEAHAKIAKALAESGERDAAVAGSARTVAMIDETVVEPTNVQIRTFFADTLSDLADAQQTIAAAPLTAVGERRARWTAARALYGRSLDIWLDLRRRGLLSAIDREKPERTTEAMAACDRMLAQ
jgi:non-specific serine/threonine protein kinase/serine/threonine-protein kinase